MGHWVKPAWILGAAVLGAGLLWYGFDSAQSPEPVVLAPSSGAGAPLMASTASAPVSCPGEGTACGAMPGESAIASQPALAPPPDPTEQAASNGNVQAMGMLLHVLNSCPRAGQPADSRSAERCDAAQVQAPRWLRQLEALAEQGDAQAQQELRRFLESRSADAPAVAGSPADGEREAARWATQDEVDRASALLQRLARGELSPATPVESPTRSRPRSDPQGRVQ